MDRDIKGSDGLSPRERAEERAGAFRPDPAEAEAYVPEDGPGEGLGAHGREQVRDLGAETGPPGTNPMNPRHWGPCGCVPDPLDGGGSEGLPRPGCL